MKLMNIKKEYVPSFIIFLILYFGFLTGGIFFLCYEAYNLYKVYQLNQSDESEEAIITQIKTPVTAFIHPLYFKLREDNKIYRINLLLLLAKNPKPGDRIEIIFNKKNDFYIVKEFVNASYGTYIVGMAVAVLVIYISILFFKSFKYFFNTGV
jgi:hypothetical protein